MGTADAMGAGVTPVWHGVPEILDKGDWVLSLCVELHDLATPVPDLLKVCTK
jgi:hypothetical protein